MSTQQPEALRLTEIARYCFRSEGMSDPPEQFESPTGDMVDYFDHVEIEKELLARITALESQLAQRFDAADMATAAAQGFRDGVAKDQQAMWRHIETAPKDGSYLLLWEQYSDAPFVGYWSGGSWSVSHEHVDAEGGWEGANVVDALSMPITHWAPLPAAPGPADGKSNV